MYKDKEKQKQANREASARRRAKAKGMTQGMTNGGMMVIPGGVTITPAVIPADLSSIKGRAKARDPEVQKIWDKRNAMHQPTHYPETYLPDGTWRAVA
jgi:hypothetical protein